MFVNFGFPNLKLQCQSQLFDAFYGFLYNLVVFMAFVSKLRAPFQSLFVRILDPRPFRADFCKSAIPILPLASRFVQRLESSPTFRKSRSSAKAAIVLMKGLQEYSLHSWSPLLSLLNNSLSTTLYDFEISIIIPCGITHKDVQ